MEERLTADAERLLLIVVSAVCDLSAGKFTPVVFRGNVYDVSRLRRECFVTC